MKTVFSVAQTNTDDASFRAWGKSLSDAMESCGFIKTADTGQIDWATVNSPGTNTFAGYEIRRLNDTMQATVPIFAKIYYGTGTSSAYPRIYITVGRTSNGAGTIPTLRTSNIILNPQRSDTSLHACYVSGGEGYIAVGMWVTSAAPVLFYLARPRDANGTINNKGINVVAQCNTLYFQQWLPPIGPPIPFTPLVGPYCTGPSVGTGTYDTTVGVFPNFVHMGYPGHPDGVGVAYFPVDMDGGGIIYSLQIFGQNYDFVSGGASSTGFINGNSTASSLLLRWE